MKFIIVGLGNFGSSIAMTLIEGGHDVIGVDNREAHINLHKDTLSHTLKMDSTNEQAIKELPLTDADAIVICIGENTGASITTAALLKKYAPKTRIFARTTSDIHKTIFESMGINDVVNPEAEFAQQFATRLTIAGNVKSMLLDDKYEIAEFEVPKSFVGKSVEDTKMLEDWKISLVTIISKSKRKNLIGREVRDVKVQGLVSGQTVFKDNDILVMFGQYTDIQKMMQEVQ
ncbi:MAG: potassium transporter TrkA [Thalassobius sp.]|nr:potassium transporter TrkA [Thalassovita sp.]